jgi:hypothetical protein
MAGIGYLVSFAVMACGMIALALGGFRFAHIHSRWSGFAVLVAGFLLYTGLHVVYPVTVVPQTVSATATPATAAPRFSVVANDYPADAVVRFESICHDQGNALATCVCLIHGMENRYTFTQFQALVAADDPQAPEYRTVAAGCVGQ